ncbi:SanA protein [Reichenbachiella faecimaris]|uniref:SanA protein n=1 Tax=Reichenbachiella faecimaris TaxID=692418 RepID=A0A1W2G6A3_REIFA|nr:ElyC/SanA/YdcF family protein [Reichenbachiella faecimaris]SMD31878.1 SanA protein [Reichenbachiella faecimaris]
MLKTIKWLVICTFSFIVICNVWIVGSTHQGIITDSRALIGAEVGLVFGTSQHQVNGESNPFFDHRVESAKQLLKTGKVERLILSGSKDSIYYDEAEAMKKALVNQGIESDVLVLDKYGNRTIESLERLRDVYGYNQCILITQEYHAYRCLFIAKSLGLQAQCFVAETPDKKSHIWALLRELLARTKAVIDLYILSDNDS